jgi:hypothetical protein
MGKKPRRFSTGDSETWCAGSVCILYDGCFGSLKKKIGIREAHTLGKDAESKRRQAGRILPFRHQKGRLQL